VQRREHLRQMVGTAVEVVRFDLGIDRVRNIAGKSSDEFAVCQSNWTCEFGGRPRDSSCRIAVEIESAWAMAYLRVWDLGGPHP
jgi:hypothetical protein